MERTKGEKGRERDKGREHEGEWEGEGGRRGIYVLLQCGLTTLETRRLRGDQIEVFKIVNGYEDVDRNMLFKLKEGSRTRGHKAALVKEQCRLDMRKYSFPQRVIHDCVNASSVNMFKNRIDRYLIRVGYT